MVLSLYFFNRKTNNLLKDKSSIVYFYFTYNSVTVNVLL